MLQTAGAKLAAYAIGSLVILITIAGLTWSRGYWKEKAEGLDEWAVSVTAVAANITENEGLKRQDVATQLIEYGNANRKLLLATEEVTAAINQQSAESERLKKMNADLRAKAEKLIAERSKLVGRLAERSLDAGDRDNCQEQLGAVVRALNELYEEGF